MTYDPLQKGCMQTVTKKGTRTGVKNCTCHFSAYLLVVCHVLCTLAKGQKLGVARTMCKGK